jgi:hypothetical protein
MPRNTNLLRNPLVLGQCHLDCTFKVGGEGDNDLTTLGFGRGEKRAVVIHERCGNGPHKLTYHFYKRGCRKVTVTKTTELCAIWRKMRVGNDVPHLEEMWDEAFS